MCLVVDTPKAEKANTTKAIGIDLGLKDIATCSDGTVISNPKYYRHYEQKLGVAQRARNKKRVRALHAKIANSRKDHLHKASTALVKNNALIIVGDLSARKLVKTKMAKSVLDTGFCCSKQCFDINARTLECCLKKSMKPIPPRFVRAVEIYLTVVRKVGQILE